MEPRYTTGSIVLLIGILLQLLSTIDYKNKLLAIGLVISLYGILISNSSGLNYYLDRYAQQADIKKCLAENNWNISSGVCYNKVAASSIGVEPIKLVAYIKSFILGSGLKQ